MTDTCSSKATTEVLVHIKNLNLTLRKHTFDWTDQIKIFYFLIRFMNEAARLKMSEAQAYIALPTVLADPSQT